MGRYRLVSGIIPAIWKTAYVAPLFKKGEKYNAVNYRPVSLTCICCKLMEHIVTSSIMKHGDTYNIFYTLQHGFRRGLSCETQLIDFIDDVTKNMDKKLDTDCIIMDFSKAFDKVNHQLLTHKLKQYGIGKKTNTWITAFLTGRSQSVVVNGQISDSVAVQSGVPQGSVLGPALFLYYINDMPAELSLHTKVRLFADDTLAYIAVSSPQDAQVMQADLDKLADWEEKWDMKFHPDKCVVLRITRKLTPHKYKYYLRGHCLKSVNNAKYLGVEISSDLRWDSHVANLCKKGNRSIGFLKRNLNVNSQTIKDMAYKTLVRPQLEYASSVWDPYLSKDIHRIEMVQRRAARYVCNRYHNRSSVSDMLMELEWPTLQQRRKQTRLIMMYRFSNCLTQVDTKNRLKTPARLSRGMHSGSFQPMNARCDVRKNSFFPQTIRDWNELPQSTTSVDSLESFKHLVRSM